MIKLGEGWIADGHRIYHKCGPGLRAELIEGREECDCGTVIPRRVRHFAGWLASEGHEVLIAALLSESELLVEADPDEKPER